jgi:hypothetical protein
MKMIFQVTNLLPWLWSHLVTNDNKFLNGSNCNNEGPPPPLFATIAQQENNTAPAENGHGSSPPRLGSFPPPPLFVAIAQEEIDELGDCSNNMILPVFVQTILLVQTPAKSQAANATRYFVRTFFSKGFRQKSWLDSAKEENEKKKAHNTKDLFNLIVSITLQWI